MNSGIPPRCLNQRAPITGDTPTASVALSLVIPVAICCQNRRSISHRIDGAPGERIAPRPVNFCIHPAGRPINTSMIKVLRRPVEYALGQDRVHATLPWTRCSKPLRHHCYAVRLRTYLPRAIKGRTGDCLPTARRINCRSGPTAWSEHQRSGPLAQGIVTGFSAAKNRDRSNINHPFSTIKFT